MGFFDRLFGRRSESRGQQPAGPPPSFGEGPMRLGGPRQTPPDENELALQRYRYMLRTAPPETVEQAHAEAFERMTPEQRAYVLQALAVDLPASERVAAQHAADDPRALARIATRTEMRSPGTMERTLAAYPPHGHGAAAGGMLSGMAGTLLMSFAAGFVGSMAASAFLDAMGDPFAAEELAPEELAVSEEGFDGGFDGGFDEF